MRYRVMLSRTKHHRFECCVISISHTHILIRKGLTMPTTTSQGVDVYYEIHGNPDAPDWIVFAHGMGGNAASWYQQIPYFRDTYRIITFDHRYFGRSRCPEEKFDPALFPDDVRAVMSAAGCERAAFVCQSMGGWTGSQMALQHPEQVSALVMCHTPGVFEHPEVENDTRAAGKLISESLHANRSPALAYDYPDKNPAGAVLYQQISAFNYIDPSAVPRAIAGANLGVDVSSLVHYEVPTLFVTGDQDVLFPSSFIEALAGMVPGAHFANLGEVGHSSYFELADSFNATVGGFLHSVCSR